MMIAILTVLAILAVFTPASAAQATIVAGPGNAGLPVYYNGTVVIQKGKTVNFLNLDIAPHDVRSTTGLFFSKIITIGKQTPVNGVKLLKKGSYKFYCSLHPIMKGTLRVI